MITILADDRIPFVSELFGNCGVLILKPGYSIQRSDLKKANALLTRSVTQVNAALLQGTAVEFVGSATAGYDHIDHKWLLKKSIFWTYAPGANAIAVAEYVLHCIAFLRKKNFLRKKAPHAAVVGVGHIGRVVSHRLKNIGFSILHNDPLRAVSEKGFISTPLEKLTKMDLICLHTPLINTGKFPTYHLINNILLKKIKPGCILLNAGRGAVIDNTALSTCDHIIICLDVWENEPDIDLDLLQKVTIGTPHIAGYSKAAKLRASLMIYKTFLEYFRLPDIRSKQLQRLSEKKILDISRYYTVEDVLLKIYDPGKETKRMRKLLIKHLLRFETLRRNYQLREELLSVQLLTNPFKLKLENLKKWGFSFN
ncbi:4-phosphoerythronate dehydrogenase [Coxiella endosymbiont of Amblyomma americanum]|uniref:4-phosphoerythronate dehydrogenase n=1 Tax=Coxiella endosymbiont of Amblyomma americanum TaxID=325775 RepID=UPI00057F6DDE|nr:4-phosphoerythronate dehydrogenase [Coxiella endosymbiont of Amblyomma americanum]AJC50190.1 erythronate-4-phosphate dehydrogenase [Coxiella endosymbiont of Amblyomma americanum]AUJ58551.1 erythronate-4-phosphate dehydrogenase [Coxiella-like endosymbiont of Amblyomma americanum]